MQVMPSFPTEQRIAPSVENPSAAPAFRGPPVIVTGPVNEGATATRARCR